MFMCIDIVPSYTFHRKVFQETSTLFKNEYMRFTNIVLLSPSYGGRGTERSETPIVAVPPNTDMNSITEKWTNYKILHYDHLDSFLLFQFSNKTMF